MEGVSFGYEGEGVAGEVVFTTSMVGYPESLTDPSYFGQILVFTYPLIGNYGVPKPIPVAPHCIKNFESEQIWVKGVIVSTYVDTPSHFTSRATLGQWLTQEKIPALSDIDTRMLTQKIREKGVMKGQIIFKSNQKKEFINIDDLNLVADVSIKKPILYSLPKPQLKKPVVLYDCGVKHGIIRALIGANVDLLRVPWDWQMDDVNKYAAVLISNGPGDPIRADKTIDSIVSVLKSHLPVFGICLGNQILALAAGGKTYKLKFGHRSTNQPVHDSVTGKSYITTHNHGFAVDMASLSDSWSEWFTNLNDGTNEGILHKQKPWFTIQFHAEANPGPQDTMHLFDHFIQRVKEYEKK